MTAPTSINQVGQGAHDAYRLGRTRTSSIRTVTSSVLRYYRFTLTAVERMGHDLPRVCQRPGAWRRCVAGRRATPVHLDEPGAQVEITEREDGVLELRPALPIPADQRWFWTDRWQEREQEVDEHVAAGQVTVHDDGQALLNHLDQLDGSSAAEPDGAGPVQRSEVRDDAGVRLRLPAAQARARATFRRVVATKFVAACDAYAANPAGGWPRSLLIKSVQGAPGVLEYVVVRQPRRPSTLNSSPSTLSCAAVATSRRRPHVFKAP